MVLERGGGQIRGNHITPHNRIWRFEYSDGSAFTAPLLSMEEASPFNNLAKIKTNIPKLGQNGAHFIRWFPTGEGANYFVAPYETKSVLIGPLAHLE